MKLVFHFKFIYTQNVKKYRQGTIMKWDKLLWLGRIVHGLN